MTKRVIDVREARQNIAAFVKRTGKNVFSFEDVCVNSRTMRRLVDAGAIFRCGADGNRKMYRLSQREARKLVVR